MIYIKLILKFLLLVITIVLLTSLVVSIQLDYGKVTKDLEKVEIDTTVECSDGIDNDDDGSIDYSNPNRIFIGTEEGIIYQSSDDGANWQNINDEDPFLNAINYIIVNPKDSNKMYIGSAGRGFFKSDDNGESWEAITNGITGSPTSAIGIHPTNPNIVYSGDNIAIFKTVDGGENWVELMISDSSIGDIIVDHSKGKTVYVATEGDGILKSKDGGDTWNYKNSGMENLELYSLAMDPEDSNILYAGSGNPSDSGDENFIYKTENGAEDWTIVHESEYAITAIEVAPSDTNVIYATPYGGGLLKSIDQGDSWTEKSDNNLYPYTYAIGIDHTDENIVYVGGLSLFANDNDLLTEASQLEGLYKTIDGGNTWFNPVNNIDDIDGSDDIGIEMILIDPLNPDIMYMGTHAPGVFYSEDAGVNWEAFNSGLLELEDNTYDHVYIYDLDLDPSGQVLYSGSCGRGVFRGLPAGSDPCDDGSCVVSSIYAAPSLDECNNNGICERSLGEQTNNCQEDCPIRKEQHTHLYNYEHD